MTIEQQVLEKLRDLPPEKQKEVLDFVDSLKKKDGPKKPPLGGGWCYLPVRGCGSRKKRIADGSSFSRVDNASKTSARAL